MVQSFKIFSKNMMIREISKQTGLSLDTIRYYEKIGLLKRENKARKGNYYKEFTELDLKILFLIQLMKEYGFTLNEIKEFMAEAKANGNNAFHKMEGRISKRINEIDEKMNELSLYRKRLTALKKNL
jgi:DNA-binding transcriptional MerR regulator